MRYAAYYRSEHGVVTPPLPDLGELANLPADIRLRVADVLDRRALAWSKDDDLRPLYGELARRLREVPA